MERYQTTINILLSLLLVVLMSMYFTVRNTNLSDPSNFGTTTTSIYPKRGDFYIHCEGMTNIESCIHHSMQVKSDGRILWLGNSQLSAINNYNLGDQNSTYLLNKLMDVNGSQNITTISLPNANLQEHLFLFLYLVSKANYSTLILPLVFDDTREDGVRDELNVIWEDQDTNKMLLNSSTGYRLSKLHAISSTSGEMVVSNKHDSLQESFESSIDHWLNTHSEIWRARGEARGWILYNFLYKIRNFIFQIKPTSKRKIILARYLNNLQALDDILNIASKRKIRVITYIAPIRADADLPYIQSEYQGFKELAEKITSKYGYSLINLEQIVPSNAWGSPNKENPEEIDFMHFNGNGHIILSNELYRYLNLKK